MTHDHGPRADLSKLVTRDLGPVIVRHRGGVSLRYWDVVSATGMRVIEVPAGLCVTTTQHRWGVAPFHYVDEFYRFILKELRSAGHNLGTETPQTTRPAGHVGYRGASWQVVGTSSEDHIFKALLNGRPYEEELLHSSVAFVSPGDVVIDIGANIGNHAAFWAMACKAQVYAFEPQPGCVAALRDTVRLNDLEGSVFVRSFGLGSGTSKARSESPDPANAGASVLVEDEAGPLHVRALDEVLLPAPSSVRLIKIDVEGMELDVLMGAHRTIQEHRPILIIECQDETAYRAVEDWVGARGYHMREAFNDSPTYMFIHEDFIYPEFYSVISHLRDIAARTSRHAILNRHSAATQWRVLGDHRRRLDAFTKNRSGDESTPNDVLGPDS